MYESVKAGVLDFLFTQYQKDKKRFVSGKTIEDLPRFRTLRKSTVGRRCRELAEDKMIERFEEVRRGKCPFVMYRFKPVKSIVWKKRKSHEAVKTI